MNKLLTLTLLACSLLLLDIPEAAAHKEARNRDLPPNYQRGFYDDRKHHQKRGKRYERQRGVGYYTKLRRHQTMPRWLKRDKSFRHWYKRSHYRQDRRLSWVALFEIYHWQRKSRRYHYRY